MKILSVSTEIGNIGIVAFQFVVVVFSEKQFCAVYARSKYRIFRVVVSEHQAIKEGLKCGFVPVVFRRIEDRRYIPESSCICPSFIVNDPDGMVNLIYPVDNTAYIHGF